MRIRFALLCLFFVITSGVKAQSFVTIPDANFVSWLQAYYPSCMSGNQMDTTCTAITTATMVNIGGEGIYDCTGIQYFDNLLELACGGNYLTSLPPLPVNLVQLSCSENPLNSLPSLPSTLTILGCSGNMTSLPPLPNGLIELHCGATPTLTTLPALPPSLEVLECIGDSLTVLPALPNKLRDLLCYQNKLTALPTLPDSLRNLLCDYNKITAIPALPDSLEKLECKFNELTALPALPSKLLELHCRNNMITSIPPLPPTLYFLQCSYNQISCFPVFPPSLNAPGWLDVSVNPFTCLPNYVPAMDMATLAYPLCTGGDVITNPFSCGQAKGILGLTYNDSNTSCVQDLSEAGMNNIHVKLYDTGGNLIEQTYTYGNGRYHFADTMGTYTVQIDTVGVPFQVQCATGIDSVVTISGALADSVDFAIACKSSFDIGVQSVYMDGWAFPGIKHTLYFTAGDLSSWLGLNCASGISGTVQITVTGPVTFDGTPLGALTPSVAGTAYTYAVSDFGAGDLSHDFALRFITNTTASFGDDVCVNVSFTPLIGDNYPENNTYYFCYDIVNSFDPNMKEVFPLDVLPNYQDWFNFTIHFQNTGNAPAMNIRLEDTLDLNFDLETFQVINYSDFNTVSLKDNALAFSFPGIMLPDSTSDPEGSKGFIQYRIKPKAGLPDGTIINNTAYIYFDYNPAVVTNTTMNHFIQNLSVEEFPEIQMAVYPNPGTGTFFAEFTNAKATSREIAIFNLLGEQVLALSTDAKTVVIDLSEKPNGVYFLRVLNEEKSLSHRIVKQE